MGERHQRHVGKKLDAELKDLNAQYYAVPRYGMSAGFDGALDGDHFEYLRLSYNDPEKFQLIKKSEGLLKVLAKKIKNRRESIERINYIMTLNKQPSAKEMDVNTSIAELDVFFLEQVNKIHLTDYYYPDMAYFEAIYFANKVKRLKIDFKDLTKIPTDVYLQIFNKFKTSADAKRLLVEAITIYKKNSPDGQSDGMIQAGMVDFLKKLKTAFRQCTKDNAELKLELDGGPIPEYKKLRLKTIIPRIRERLGRKRMKSLGVCLSDLY